MLKLPLKERTKVSAPFSIFYYIVHGLHGTEKYGLQSFAIGIEVTLRLRITMHHQLILAFPLMSFILGRGNSLQVNYGRHFWSRASTGILN